MKLSKTVVDRIPFPPRGQVFYWDDELSGFGLRVTPSRKTYIAQRRVSGRTVRVTLAPHGVYTPDQARKQALRRLGEMAGGTDHNRAKKRDAAHAVTLSEAYTDYITCKTRTANTLRDYKKAMDKGFPEWKDKPIVSISRGMIERRFDQLSKASPAQANQMFRFLRAVLNFAMEKYSDAQEEPLIPSNPCNRLTALNKWHRVNPRTRSIHPEKLKSWFSGLSHDTNDSEHRNAVRDLCALLLLTGLREQEGASLRWEDVDLSAKWITIRNTKNHREHVLPIGTWLTDLLSRRRLQVGLSPFVFPADNKAGHIKYHRKDVLALSSQSGVDFRLHDLRRSFASIVNHHLDRSLSAYTVKKLLNHASGGDVTAGYIQFGADDLRVPMQLVEDFVLKCAGLKETAEVTALQRQSA